jgi:biopolymer transport protein ExbD
VRATLALVTLCALALLLTSCAGQVRDPSEIVTLVVMAKDDSFRLDNEPMNERQLRQQLRAIADANRMSTTGRINAVVRLSSEATVDYDRVRAIEDFCTTIGLDRIEKEQ